MRSTTAIRSGADLRRYFAASPGQAELVGIESEYGLVDPLTGRSVPYPTAEEFLRALLVAFPRSKPVHERHLLVGVRLADGAEFSLETGCGLEYSSAPRSSVAGAVDDTLRDMTAAARVGAECGIALLSGGMLPFTPPTDVPWLPKQRVGVMRDYFAGLGDDGSGAAGVMALTLSTQTSLDYVSETDLEEKMRLHVAAGPIAAALFVNSPLEGGRATGALSRRMQLWRKFDPRRCGVLGFAADDSPALNGLVEWAMALPMIYRREGDAHVAAPARPFASLVEHGFDDGTRPTFDDWELHLSQVWPHVRVRRTLELRAPDGLMWPHFGAVPAFWVGLTYDPGIRREALDLLAGVRADELEQLTDAVALDGLRVTEPLAVRSYAARLLELAHAGLAARVARGVEPERVLGLLEPLDEVVESGVTFAERTLARWSTEFEGRPERYVAAYRVPDTPGA
ncbi:glutamate--cysteine ligase [Virgisporangium aliadipatigenens]|uniref:Glutamate--cysteine ligase n=1 Tax=Virgisporangium aliadipatigenens TaxID=741659 RepID=A0A8J4DRS7_9ACTN|nr:glutamate-cysteine ligase family protein [Virgisporangium aliadipatigenens]GIJ48460.1 glutamate--cysteine ligase [Virgisporangium aliadipatigenens]